MSADITPATVVHRDGTAAARTRGTAVLPMAGPLRHAKGVVLCVSMWLGMGAFAVDSGTAHAAEPMKCEAGPITKTFGGTPWLVYACADGRSVVVVSAPGNPAMPFYFMFSAEKSGYRLVAEGTGNRQATAAALAQLRGLSDADIKALGAEAARGGKSLRP